MSSPLQLRDYQEEAVQAHYDFFAAHQDPERNPIVVVPTGGGKSLIIAEFLRRSTSLWPRCRFLVATHVQELITQNYAEYVRHRGGLALEAGIYSAGVGRKDQGARVLFAGIQSICDLAPELGWFDVILIDECHLVPKKGEGRYRTYIAGQRQINPRVRVVGYSATPFRLDGGLLHRGEGRIFTDVAYEVRLETLLNGGHLAPLVAKKTETSIDLSGVATSSGDFAAGAMESAAMAEGCVDAACTEIVAVAHDMKRFSWLLFAAGKDHARNIRDVLEQIHGVETGIVFGDTDRDERASVTDRFKSGALRALVNVGVLTTGFNAPRCDLLAILRGTQSASLYVQIMGRGMRTFPGKRDCLVLDYGGNIERHGPINCVRPRRGESGKSTDVMPVKTCPTCRTILALGISPCPECGHEWPRTAMVVEHARVASALSPIDIDSARPRVLTVDRWILSEHVKADKPMMLRVDLDVGGIGVTEWVLIEHGGFPARKAATWWYEHGGLPPAPGTVAAALERRSELERPVAIEVVRDGDYDRVYRRFFARETAE